MFFYHEVWFEEIQTFLIAKDASFFDMIFSIPHFEGHPPFYNILLSLPAKLGLPIDYSLRIISFAFSFTATALLLFKAPFKRIVKLLIPFSYFIFYQYSVICRPYSIMYLAFVLAAITYINRNKKPILYILSLALLCMSSAYGILLAGSICIVWTIEILNELKGGGFFKKAFTDRRALYLFCILVFAIILLLIIWPDSNSYATVASDKNHLLKCIVYVLLILPGDCFLIDSGFNGVLQYGGINMISFDFEMITMFACSLIVYYLIIKTVIANKKLIYFIIPVFCFSVYASIGYFSEHHLGVYQLFILYLMWICFSEKKDLTEKKTVLKYNLFDKILFAVICIMSIGWSFVSSFNDVTNEVWYSKSLANFMDDYNLDDLKVMAGWDFIVLNDNLTDSSSNLLMDDLNDEDVYHLVNKCSHPDFLVYDDNGVNYIINFNDMNDSKRYIDFNCLPKEEADQYLMNLGKTYGYPDVFIGNPDLLKYMGLDINTGDYGAVYKAKYVIPNKFSKRDSSFFVFVKDDIYYSRNDWPMLNGKE